MREFPLTDRPIWGSSQPSVSVADWRTELQFGDGAIVEQDAVPLHDELSAVLRSERAGVVRFSGPGGTIEADLSSGPADVSSVIRTGKHRYRLTDAAGAPVEATCDIRARQPIVPVEDEAYVLDLPALAESRRQLMAAERGAPRVGRWTTWWTAVGLTPTGELLADPVGGRWSTTGVIASYGADFSGANAEDTEWVPVALPHAPAADDGPGFIWYRASLPRPEGDRVVLVCPGFGGECTVWVDGHEAGFADGRTGPFVFDVTRFAGDRTELDVTVRVFADPERLFPGFGINATDRFGVAFSARLPGAEEGALTVTPRDEQGTAVAFVADSRFVERPPALTFSGLTGGTELTAIADPEHDALHLFADHVGRLDFRFGDDYRPEATLEVVAGGIRFVDAGDVVATVQVDGAAWVVEDRVAHATVPGAAVVRIAAGASAARGVEPAARGALEAEWERTVYGVARPFPLSDERAALWRTAKQTVLLNARVGAGDTLDGLLADFDKPVFSVYWIRDACISSPGALYSGPATTRAVDRFASETLAQYGRTPTATGLFPDGTVRGGVFSDGPAFAVIAQERYAALNGREWAQNNFATTREMIDRLLELDTKDGDRADGVIRASEGDAKDFASMELLRRQGSALFLNAAYLAALAAGARLAELVGESESARVWRERRELGIRTLNAPPEEGGLWLEDRGHFAEWASVIGRSSWVFPAERDDVTVFGAFDPIGHGMVLAEGILSPERAARVVAAIERYRLDEGVPAPAHFPFYDILRHLDLDGVPEDLEASDPWRLATRWKQGSGPAAITAGMVLPWKGWPGNHMWGGRWPLSGGWLALGLWSAAADRAERLHASWDESLRRMRHPGRHVEVESYSGVTREETGRHADPAGYYQLWSAAMAIQALVEGAAGGRPAIGGAVVHPERLAPGAGLERLPVLGGELSYHADAEGYHFDVTTTEPGRLELPGDWSGWHATGAESASTETGIALPYAAGSTTIRLMKAGHESATAQMEGTATA